MTRLIGACCAALALSLAGCTAGTPSNGAAGRAVPRASAGTVTSPPVGTPAIGTTWRVRLTSHSTLAEYPATTVLVATACGSPQATWHGTLTFDSRDVAAAERVRSVTWTFAPDGTATVPLGPYHATLDGERYTATFTVYLTLATAGAPAITVDDARIHTRGYPDVSMKPFSAGYGTPTKLSKTDEPC